jgi:hypothetical protein
MLTELKQHIPAILGAALLCGFWVIVQMLAKKHGTKHSLNWPQSAETPADKSACQDCAGECHGTDCRKNL